MSLPLLLGVSALVLVAVAVGVVVLGDDTATTPVRADEGPTTTFPEEWDPRVAPIADWVEQERGLGFLHPVEVHLLTDEEYLAEAGSAGGGADTADAEAADDRAATLRALGMASGEVDLAAVAGDLAGEGTLAFYSTDEKKVYVRGTELTPAVRVTVAHELTHVLQDQHHDLGRLGEDGYERGEGLRAMAEGDAQRIEEAYVETQLTPEEVVVYEEESQAAFERAQEALDGVVPPSLGTFSAAPYILGRSHVARLLQTDGDAAVDAALRLPPTEEELLLPAVGDSVRSEVIQIDAEAPDGAEVIDEDTFGPLAWYLLFASRNEPAAALRAIDGWAGDRMVTYRQGGRVCVTLVVVGDHPVATDELRANAVRWASLAPTGAAAVDDTDGHVRLRSCDPGAEAQAVGEIDQDLLAFPLVRSALETGLLQTGLTPAQADCVAGRLVDLIPPAVLFDPTAGADPAVQDAARTAGRDCS